MKKIMFVGQSGSGKTTLLQYLKEEDVNYHKTQQVYFDKLAIDTPGEFMENRFYNNALVSTSVEADYVALVQSLEKSQNYFPPLFFSRFTKPVIGIITKVDLENYKDKLEVIKEYLKLAGAKDIFVVSVFKQTGMDQLIKYLKN